MQNPDYQTLRQQRGFSWSVGCDQSFLIDLAGISFREFYLEPGACIDAYRKGQSRMRELFGDDVRLTICTPSIRYGHVNGLGSELLFPEQGEVAHTHIYSSLEEGIDALKKVVDFAAAGRMPFYLDFWNEMKKAFPDQPVIFGFGCEGPITTAWELRGEGFFTDLYDHPSATKEFLSLTTANIHEFYSFYCSLYNTPVVSPDGCFMADDVAAMIPPDLWRAFVLPYWERHYLGTTTGSRQIHVEDLKPGHLKFLEMTGISYYDPCLSRHLTPRTICQECRIPFDWSLQGFDLPNMGHSDIEEFVVRAAADGASRVCLGLEWGMANELSIQKVHTFIKVAKEVKHMRDKGATPNVPVDGTVNEREIQQEG